MNEDLLNDKLEKYVRGLLTQEEAGALERDLAENPKLQEQLRLQRLEVEAAEYLLRENLRQQVRAWTNAETAPDNTKKKPIYWGKTGLYLLVLTAIGLLINQYRSKENNAKQAPAPSEQAAPPPDTTRTPMAEQENTPTTNDRPNNEQKHRKKESRYFASVVARAHVPRNLQDALLKSDNSGEAPASPLEGGIQAFQRGNYDRAIQQFSAIKSDESVDLYLLAQEWLAHAWFQKGLQTQNLQQAARLFQAQADKNTQDAAQDQAEWYWMLCLYADYPANAAKVDELLLKMSKDGYHTYQEAALELLKELGK